MAHDIGFYEFFPFKEGTEDDKTGDTIGYFFGFAGGLFYDVFDAHHCNGGCSGTNEGVIRTAVQLKDAIERIKSAPVYTQYPDPKRLVEIVNKLEQYLETHPDGHIFIHYS